MASPWTPRRTSSCGVTNHQNSSFHYSDCLVYVPPEGYEVGTQARIALTSEFHHGLFPKPVNFAMKIIAVGAW
jgi:hypothetical protein